MDRLRNTGPTAVPHPLLTSVPYTVPLVCYNRLKRVSLEVKLIASSCNTRMRCACMWETHGNIIFHNRTNFCVRVCDPRKLCKKMCENYICKFQRLLRHASMLIRTRIHKCKHLSQEDAISFTSIDALFKRS